MTYHTRAHIIFIMDRATKILIIFIEVIYFFLLILAEAALVNLNKFYDVIKNFALVIVIVVVFYILCTAFALEAWFVTTGRT